MSELIFYKENDPRLPWNSGRARKSNMTGITRKPVELPETGPGARWRGLVDAATEAFGTDYRYAEAIAEAYHRLQGSKKMQELHNRVE